MSPILALVLAMTLSPAFQSSAAPPPGLADYAGKVQSGMMAIGGETTGIVIVTDQGRFELAAEGAMRQKLTSLNGQQVTVRGRLVVRPGVEVGTRRIITVTEIRAPRPLMQRERGALAYEMLGRPSAPESATAIAALPDAVQPEFKRRLDVARTYIATNAAPASPTSPDKINERLRHELEIGLVALTGKTQAAAEAAAYAKAAKLYYEWEGDPSGPMDETQAVATYISENRASPLRPYLELFALHRARAAFEAAGSGATVKEPARQAALQKEAAGLYQSIWTRLQQSTDPLVKALAEDIDNKPYVYIDIAAHPRKPS